MTVQITAKNKAPLIIARLNDISTVEDRFYNATLIKAAPDLLEALKAMQRACDEWAAEFTQKKRAMNWGIVNDAYCKAAAAIAKATGHD